MFLLIFLILSLLISVIYLLYIQTWKSFLRDKMMTWLINNEFFNRRVHPIKNGIVMFIEPNENVSYCWVNRFCGYLIDSGKNCFWKLKLKLIGNILLWVHLLSLCVMTFLQFGDHCSTFVFCCNFFLFYYPFFAYPDCALFSTAVNVPFEYQVCQSSLFSLYTLEI